MPTIKISDTFSTDLDSVSVSPNPIRAALEKYVTSPLINIVLLPDLVNSLRQPLLTARQNPISLGFNFARTIDFSGSTSPELSIGGGTKQNVNVNATPGSPLFADDLFGSNITVANGEGWLSLALNGTVSLGVMGTTGDLTFGITAGGGFGTEYFRKFAVTATTPTVAEALGELLSDFTLPGDVSDLEAMHEGDISTVSGNGTFTLSGDVILMAGPNPLASPSLPLGGQTIELQAGAQIDLGASFELSGAYQIRVRRLAQKSVELGYYRKKGTQWSVSATASVGVGVVSGADTATETDLLARLLGGLTGRTEADVVQLVNAGLSDDEIAQMQDAIADSIDHSLKASLELELSNSNTNEAAFLYQIDISALSEKSLRAVQAALDGNLSLLTHLEKNDDGTGVIAPGVTMVRSIFKKVRDKKASLKINLLGLLNFSSVFELIQNGEVVFEPITGELTINETVSGTHLGLLVLPSAHEKLRKIKFDSLLVTTAYRAGKAVSSMKVTSSDVHFAFNQNTNEHTMSDYLDGLLGVGLIDAKTKQQLMAGFHGSGPSTFLLRAEFSDPACEAMFLTSGGAPRPQLEYELIGRSALQILLLPGDQNDGDKYRRDVLASDPTWAKLKDKGTPGFGIVLPALANDVVRLNVVRSDYTAVMWWAESMASTAEKLAELRKFISAADPATLQGNKKFIGLRSDLQKHVAGVVANSGLQFGLPFGLVALFQAAAPLAVPGGTITSESLTRTFDRATAAGGV